MDPSTAVNAAATTIITAWGVPGAVVIILLAIGGGLAWLLIRSYHAQVKASDDRTTQIRADLEAKYKDADSTREVLRELKTSIDMNTKTMDTALAFLQGKMIPVRDESQMIPKG